MWLQSANFLLSCNYHCLNYTIPPIIHTFIESLKVFVWKHIHFYVYLFYHGNSAELLTRRLMLPHVEHLIELAEGTVRSHRLGLVCIHLDGAEAISSQAWENDCLHFFYGLICGNEQMPAKSSIRRNLPDHTVVVSVSSIWTYSLVTMKSVGCNSGFVCDCGLDGSIKRRCLIFPALPQIPFSWFCFRLQFTYITPRVDTCGGCRKNNLLYCMSSPLRL